MATIFSDSENASLLETAIKNYVQDIYPTNVLLSHIDRSEMGGSPHPLAIKIGGAVVNGSFATGSAAAKEVLRYEAKLNERLLYAFGLTKGPGARSSKGAGKKAIVDIAADCESDTRQRGSSFLEMLLLSSTGYGEFATVASHTGTTGAGTLVLTNPAAALFIKVSDVLAAKDVASTASLRTGTFVVSGVDSQTGTITGTAAGSWDSSAGAGIDGAVIGFSGMLENTTAHTSIIGLPGWLNRTAVDIEGLTAAQRAANPQETSGWYTTGTLGVRDSINLMANQVLGVSGGKSTMVLVGPDDFQELQDDLGDRVVIEPTMGTVPVNFDGITFLTAKGPRCRVFCSPALKKNRYMLDPSSLHLVTPVEELWAPVANYGDRGFRSLEGSDALRLDLVMQGAFGISHPAAQARYVRT
jgi:hypothetical protein